MQRAATKEELVGMRRELKEALEQRRRLDTFETALNKTQELCPGMGKMYALLSETESILRSLQSGSFSRITKLKNHIDSKTVEYEDDD
jgi:hypothetical protein